jgi:hypothetical protein
MPFHVNPFQKRESLRKIAEALKFGLRDAAQCARKLPDPLLMNYSGTTV